MVRMMIFYMDFLVLCVEVLRIWEVGWYDCLVDYVGKMDDGCQWNLCLSISENLMEDNKCKESHFFDMGRNQRVCTSNIGCKSSIFLELMEGTLLMLIGL